MNYEINGEELRIFLPERLTADKFSEVREGILDITEKNTFSSLVLDARNTAYVSSSGLRIVIEVQKKYGNMSVINANLDVYDVFEMTGLSEVIRISKAKKQVSVEGCPLLGHGNNGNVYRYNEDTIIKVYTRCNVRLQDIEREHQLARRAFVLGVPTALSMDIVLVGENYGAMYEMVGADSVLGLVYKHPEEFDRYVRKFAEGMKYVNSIHAGKDPILTDKKQEYAEYIRDIRQDFTEEEYREVTDFLDSIPESDTLVHGDYHLGNVMLQGEELLLIDMDTLGYGSYLIEIANLFFTLLGVSMVMGEDHFYDMDDRDKERCWKLVTDCIFEGVGEEEKQRGITAAEALSLCRALRIGRRRNTSEERALFVKAEILRRIRSLSLSDGSI